MDNSITDLLFKTNAIQIINPGDDYFQLTSGELSPYYINAHYLLGTQYAAEELLRFIDFQRRCSIKDPVQILNVLLECYKVNDIYGDVINDTVEFILGNIDIDEIDYVSGGERRDWFFSLMIANLLKKPHISLYKDGKCIITSSDELWASRIAEGTGTGYNFKSIHISDTLTKASSFEKYWLPTISKTNCSIKWSLAVVDRNQGGSEKLKEHNIKSYSMVDIDRDFWDKALSKGYISIRQYHAII